MNLTTATPVEIDQALAKIYDEMEAAQIRIERLTSDIHRYAGDKGRPVSRNRRVYELDFRDAEAKAREFAATDLDAFRFAFDGRGRMAADAEAARRVLATLDEMRAIITRTEEEAEPLEAEHTRRGWSRFFLVTSSDGHVHSSQSCGTCNPRTRYGWLPELSGLTMAQAIAVMDKRGSAEILCTVCFPDAPVARTQKPVDDKLCPGSGTMDYPRETARRGYAAGNYGVCRHCGQRITITSTWKMRKHNKV